MVSRMGLAAALLALALAVCGGEAAGMMDELQPVRHRALLAEKYKGEPLLGIPRPAATQGSCARCGWRASSGAGRCSARSAPQLRSPRAVAGRVPWSSQATH